MEFDPYIVDTLMPDLVGHDRQPAAFLVYLLLWRRTQESTSGWVAITLREFAESTGLSKRAVQSAIQRLIQRKLISVRRTGITEVGKYSVHAPWARSDVA